MSPDKTSLTYRILKPKCPFVAVWFPWYWRQSEMAELRKQAGRFTWKINQGLARRLILIIKTLVWPLVAFIQILTLLCTSSKEVATMNRRSQIRQLFDLIYFTFWRGFPSEEYYKTSFYNENLFLVIDDFISGKELLILNSLISEGRDPALINNKLRFDEHCRNNHLAVVPILEIYSNGKREQREPNLPIPKTSLYLKPVNGLQGRGI